MSYPEPLSQWREIVSTAFPRLSQPQATVLALWSYGMVLAKSCGITLVCATLALQLGCSEACLVQRLREWCYAAKDKRGDAAASIGREHLFCAVIALDLELVASR